MPTTDQISLQNIAAEFIQKSHIAAVDVTYDLTPAFSIGGKYAYRIGQISLDRENPEFFDNDASLVVVRGDYSLTKNWEFLLEGRLLDMSDLNERRSGALATVSAAEIVFRRESVHHMPPMCCAVRRLHHIRQCSAGLFWLNAVDMPAGTGSGFVWDHNGHVVTDHSKINDSAYLAVDGFP